MGKRWICGILAFALALSLAACGSAEAEKGLAAEPATEPEPQTALSEELTKALDLGFASEDMLEDREQPITFREYAALLDKLVEMTLPERMGQWQERSAFFREKGETMTRIEGAIALLYAAECLDVDTVGMEYMANLEGKMNPDSGLDFWKGVFGIAHRLQGYDEIYPEKELRDPNWSWRFEYSYLQNSGWFVQQRSYVSGKTYFDYDRAYMLNFGLSFTREAAVTAVLRLYETATFCIYVPVEQVLCTISQEALAMGAALPEATEEKLPDWHGFSIAMREWGQGNYGGMLYQEEEIAAAAQQGFNFVRVPLDARNFFPGEDYTRINPAQLENLDQLIDWCARYGIHVCIDIHDMVGFNTGGDESAIDLFTNPQRAEQFASIWAFFARHYRDVPPNQLSFNLLNEPHAAEDLTDEGYAAVMRPAIEAIRKENPNRIIVADMIGWLGGSPSWELVETGVVQSFHPYLVTGGKGFSTWPLAVVNPFVHKSDGIFTLNGSFPAGTRITVDLSGFHSVGALNVQADGKTVASYPLGQEKPGENGCTQVGEEGTGGEFRFYEGLLLETTLPGDASKLALVLEGNSWWYTVNSVLIDTGATCYEITASNDVVPEGQVPNLVLEADGSISGGETAVTLNRETLAEMFSELAQFREETGIQIMAQELGFSWQVPQKAALGAFDALLYAMDMLDIPWCSWCQDFGPMMDAREVEMRLNDDNAVDLRRPGSTYVSISENWILNEDLMDVFKTYMNS